MASSTSRSRGYISELGIKTPVDVASTANLTLEGEQTIDGVTTSESRVLVKDQTDASENGIYISAAGSWERAADFDGQYDVRKGTLVTVAGGTAQAGTIWRLDTSDPDIGTDDLTFNLSAAGRGLLLSQTTTETILESGIDVRDGAFIIITLTGNKTLAEFVGHTRGECYNVLVQQDGTGGHTLSYDAAFLFPGGTAPTLSTGPNAKDILSFVSDGTYLYGVSQLDFS